MREDRYDWAASSTHDDAQIYTAGYVTYLSGSDQD